MRGQEDLGYGVGGSAPNKFTGSLQFTRDKVLGLRFPEMFRLDTWILGPHWGECECVGPSGQMPECL